MLAGLIVTLVYIFLHKGWFFIPDTNSFTDADPLLGTIKSTSFGAVGAALNFAVAYVVSGMTKPLPQEIKDLVESVRVPRGAGCRTGRPLNPCGAGRSLRRPAPAFPVPSGHARAGLGPFKDKDTSHAPFDRRR